MTYNFNITVYCNLYNIVTNLIINMYYSRYKVSKKKNRQWKNWSITLTWTKMSSMDPTTGGLNHIV